MQARLDVCDVILYAVRGEKASFAVYAPAAARAANPAVSRVLNRLARDALCEAVGEEGAPLAACSQLASAIGDDARGILQTIMRRERRHVGLREGLLRHTVEADAPFSDNRSAP